MTETHESWFVLSLARGLSVIRAFNGEAGGLTVSEVAQRCGLSRAAARRFLLTLAKLDYVACRGDRYILRPTALDLGYAFLSSMPLDSVVQPELDNVSRLTGESCSLGILSGTDVLFVARAPARRLIKIHIGIGSRLPAHATSLGKILLAHLAPKDRDRIIESIAFTPYTPDTIAEAGALRHELDAVRRNGYSTAFGELDPDIASIAVPVTGAAGSVVAAINISTYTGRLKEEGGIASFLDLLGSAAERIGHALRASPYLEHVLYNSTESRP